VTTPFDALVNAQVLDDRLVVEVIGAVAGGGLQRWSGHSGDPQSAQPNA